MVTSTQPADARRRRRGRAPPRRPHRRHRHATASCCAERRLPRRRHPRDRARAVGGDADEHHDPARRRRPACAATPRTLARRHPRLLWGARARCTARRRSPRWPRPGCSATWSRPSSTAPPPRTSTGSSPLLAGFLVVQTVLTRYARYVSQVLGEQVLAELREDFVGNALALPVGVVESAGSGDLLTRTSRDVDQLGWSVRWALPEWTIAVVTAVLTFAAALSVGWWVAAPLPARRAAAGDRAALVPRPRQGRLPARERVVLRTSTRRSPRPSRAPAPSRRSASPTSGSTPRRATSRSRTTPSGTRCSCARCSSRTWRSPT